MKIIFSIFFFIAPVEFISAQGKFFGGNGDGFATATISNQVLPLVIESFEGRQQTDIAMFSFVRLSFTITSDEAICHIIIERSGDRNAFLSIDTVHHSMTAGAEENFSIQDLSPVPGNNYYRLRILKCSGNVVYSKIILVNVAMKNNIYYSTADKKLYYHLQQKGILQVFSSAGQLMKNEILVAGTGSVSMDMPATGIFLYKFTDGSAGKFFKQF